MFIAFVVGLVLMEFCVVFNRYRRSRRRLAFGLLLGVIFAVYYRFFEEQIYWAGQLLQGENRDA